MPFVTQYHHADTPITAQIFLMKYLGFSPKTSQRLIAKARFFANDKLILKQSQIVQGDIKIIVFEGSSKGLTPIYENKYFALFDKPHNLLVHPQNRSTLYCLLDEARYHFGDEACLCHRIDYSTSGLVLISKNKKYESSLKALFETRQIDKTYIAIVEGNIKEPITINQPLIANLNLNITKAKSLIDKNGKKSITKIVPISYDKSTNTTKIYAKPLTGRLHQIRAHLHYIGHRIVGDPLYGVSFDISDRFLDNLLDNKSKTELLGASRLMLHAYELSFKYKNIPYQFTTKAPF